MKPIPPALQSMLDDGVTTVCFCWRIDRKDGVTMGFTDHDVDLSFDGVDYEKTTSFTASAMESQLGLAVSNMDVLGALASDSITEDDLECGRYDGAALTIYLVNWQDAEDQHAVIMAGPLGQVTIGDLAYQAEVRSLAQHYAQYIGSLCQGNCRSDFGDTGSGLDHGCRFALPDPVPCTVTGVISRSRFTVSASGSFPPGTRGSLSGGYFAEGGITFLTGANQGVSMEILGSDETILIQTKAPLPDDIEIGDTATLQIGCDKTVAVCSGNYANIENFRGEPYVPGTDQVFKINGE